MGWYGLLTVLAGATGAVDAYFADWSLLARDREPTCVDIPENMTLCHNIGYNKMRLPNLVEHDTLHEVSQQSMSWIPLLNIKCHPATQLFLCSLFSPICLESPIYPCRSLCAEVRAGCEGRMSAYGFPWPAMLDCAQFPEDNDMCITARAAQLAPGAAAAADSTVSKSDVATEEVSCSGTPCDQHLTAENILDNFCRADFVVKVKIAKVHPRRLVGKKAKVFRAWKGSTRAELRALRNPRFRFNQDQACCTQVVKQQKKKRYLVMGKRGAGDRDFFPTFLVPWSKSKELKRARRMFKEMNCDNLKETSQKMIVDTFAPSAGGRRSRRRSRRDRKRKPASIWDGLRS